MASNHKHSLSSESDSIYPKPTKRSANIPQALAACTAVKLCFMSPPPIILIHRGDSFYLAHTIAQACSSNPDNRLILLGDRSNSFYLGVEHHHYEDYFDEAREFAKLFTYEYFPNYQYPWILFCHQKYFALYDFVREQGIENFLLIDSDVLLYEPIEPYFSHYSNAKLTVTSPDTAEAAAAGFAIVNTPEIVSELCATYTDMFTAKGAGYLDRTETPLFTEMAGIYRLWQNNPESVVNTHDTAGEFVINSSVLVDHRFMRKNGLLEIHWQDRVPHFARVESGEFVKSPIIHFHGHAKKVMSRHLKLRGISVRLTHAANRMMSALAKYPMRATNRIMKRAVFPGI